MLLGVSTMRGFLPQAAKGWVASRMMTRNRQNLTGGFMMDCMKRSRAFQSLFNSWAMVALIVLCAPFFVTHCASASDVVSPTPVPTFLFQDIKGQDHDLSEFRGRYVLLTLWASWCGYCGRELPQLDHLAGGIDDQHLQIISISVDRDPLVAAESFYHRHSLTHMAIYGDVGGNIMSLFDVNGLPFSVLIDPHGREVERFLGSVDWNSPDVRDYLSMLTKSRLFRS